MTDPIIAFESQAAWEAWLADQHATSNGVWVKIAKKVSGIPTVTHAEALESALCYGWIDGQRNRFDDRWFLQRFTPRRSRSNWSKVNRGKAERLIDEGRMQPAGLREIERARHSRLPRLGKAVARRARVRAARARPKSRSAMS